MSNNKSISILFGAFLIVVAVIISSYLITGYAYSQDWEGTGVISGTVRDENGLPIGPSTVRLRAAEPGSTDTYQVTFKETDASGNFRFEYLGTIPYYVIAGTNVGNYFHVTFPEIPEDPHAGGIVLADGEHQVHDLTLGRATSIVGTIKDIYGNPMESVIVTAVDSVSHQNRGSIFSTATGEFAIGLLQPGTYHLTTKSSEIVTQLHPGILPTAGGYDYSLAATITVTEGMPGTADVIVDRQPNLDGTIRDSSGQPIEDVRVTLVRKTALRGRQDSASQHFVNTDAEGRYSFSLEYGYSYNVLATPNDYVPYIPAYYPGVENIAEALSVSGGLNGTETADFNLIRYGRIQGEISKIGGGYADSLSLVELYHADNFDLGPAGSGGMVYESTQGEFVFDYLTPGEYVMHVFPFDGAYIAEYAGKTLEFNEATRIEADLDETTEFNLVLDRKGTIDVKLKQPDGSAYTDPSRIEAYKAEDGNFVSNNHLDFTNHQVDELEIGEYLISSNGGNDGLFGSYYEDASNILAAKTIAVDRNQIVEIEMNLFKGGKIDGQISVGGIAFTLGSIMFTPADMETCTNNLAGPVWASLDTNGYYQTDWLIPGVYETTFGRFNLGNGYELYDPEGSHFVRVDGNNTTVLNLGLAIRPVARSAANVYEEMSIQTLERTGNSISGRLTNRFGDGINDLTVSLFDSDGVFVRTTTTNGDGFNDNGLYHFDELDNGNYYLLANSVRPTITFGAGNNCSLGLYEGAYYPYEAAFETAQLIAVNEARSDVEIDMTLQVTGRGTPIWPNYKTVFLPIIVK